MRRQKILPPDQHKHWENLSATGLRMMINQRFSELTAMYQRSERFTAADIEHFQLLNEELLEMRRHLAVLESRDAPHEAERLARLYSAGLISTNEVRDALGIKPESRLDEIMNESGPVHDEVQRRMKAIEDKQEEWSDEMYAEKFRRKRRYHKD